MKWMMKLATALLLSQFAYAVDNNCTPACPPKPCKPCCPPVCFERGYPNDQCCFPSAYNEPASYDLGPCAWDFWLDASFTYWEAQQEGLDLAINTVANGSAIPLVPVNGTLYLQDNSYKPGFKVGLGMDLGHDDWSAFAEYVWFRSTTSTRATAPADSREGTPVLSIQDWLLASPLGGPVNAQSLSSNWKLGMDLIDVGATRPYYQGTHLILSPFGTLRGQFIRQKLTLTASDLFQSSTALPSATSTNKSHSWAVGPRAGCLAKWHLGWGFRFEGDVAASILYTRYTKVSFNRTNVLAANASLPNNSMELQNYNCLRAVNEMNVGLGWGSYFGCRKYHFDLLASYDFQVFWNQNMMRDLTDVTVLRSSYAANNLYLQGLTVRAEFDF